MQHSFRTGRKSRRDSGSPSSWAWALTTRRRRGLGRILDGTLGGSQQRQHRAPHPLADVEAMAPEPSSCSIDLKRKHFDSVSALELGILMHQNDRNAVPRRRLRLRRRRSDHSSELSSTTQVEIPVSMGEGVLATEVIRPAGVRNVLEGLDPRANVGWRGPAASRKSQRRGENPDHESVPHDRVAASGVPATDTRLPMEVEASGPAARQC